MWFWLATIALGLLGTYAHRNDMNSDGISYIEMARAASRSGLHELVNAYWSPLYPWLLSIVFRAFHPSLYWEFTVVHLVNLGIFLTSFACFEVFLKELLAVRQASEEAQERFVLVSPRTIWAWGCIFFLWASQFWLSTALVTPDLCVAGLAYLATAMLLRLRRDGGSWAAFAWLGAILGISYWAKAAMFPSAFVFLGSSLFLLHSWRRALPKALLALTVFSFVAAPLIVALSKSKNRVTFGDSARINAAEYINGATSFVHWQEPSGTGVPAHPTRKVISVPAMYEFSSPVKGSYPPWYDPSYWYEGIRPHFSWRGQAWAIFRAASAYLKFFSRAGTLWIVLLVLLIFRGRKMTFAPISSSWFVIVPSVAVLGIYLLVHVEFRFVSPFALMLLLWFLAHLRTDMDSKGLNRFRAAMVLAPVLAIVWPMTNDLIAAIRSRPNEPWEVAQGLVEAGISPGTDVGYIGTGLDAYWAHLAGVRIVAEIPGEGQKDFVAADPARKQEIFDKFAAIGASAVVTKNPDAVRSLDGWHEIRGTHYSVWNLRNRLANGN